MTQSEEIAALLRAHAEELERLGVVRLRLFGSAARGEAGAESDVDLLVTLSPPVTFDRYMDVKLFLEALLARPVDLVTDKALRPELRDRIEREAIRVA